MAGFLPSGAECPSPRRYCRASVRATMAPARRPARTGYCDNDFTAPAASVAAAAAFSQLPPQLTTPEPCNSAPFSTGEQTNRAQRRVGSDRRGTITGRRVPPMTPGYRGAVIRGDQGPQADGIRVAVPSSGPGASASPTKTPQLGDSVADPHRDPTDETAHSGTIVIRVKDTENSRSAASMRVSWAVGVFSDECSRDDRAH